MYENFEDVKVGDKVILKHSQDDDRALTVIRCTAKQFQLTNGLKFWKKDGGSVGSYSVWYRIWCVKADDESISKANAVALKRMKRNRIQALISSANLMNMEDDSLDTILKVLTYEQERDEEKRSNA